MRRLAFLLPFLLLAGCYYLLKQSTRQIIMLLNQRDVDDMLADPSVPPETRSKLLLVGAIKEFGERRLRLTRTSNYTRFHDTEGRPVVFLISASRKDRFEPYTWWFPVVGTVPYKGFFDREDAVWEARILEEEGWDVAIGGAAAYSTLGYFPDPVLSTMLDLPEERLAALLLHEMTHGTLYVPGRTDFNEGLASFVGWQGALEFARERYGVDSKQYDGAVRAWAREERRDREARELFRRLDEFYRSDAPPGARIRLRDSIAGRPVNNAEILMQRRYGRLGEFRDAFERADGSWARFFREMREQHETTLR